MIDRSKYSEMKRRGETRRMLEEWYGKAYADDEIAAYTSPGREVGEVLDSLETKIFSDEVRKMLILKREWVNIAGPQLAALTAVSSFNAGVLELEVRHSAFLRELAGVEDLLISRVNAVLGPEQCRNITFAASSGAAAWKRRRT